MNSPGVVAIFLAGCGRIGFTGSSDSVLGPDAPSSIPPAFARYLLDDDPADGATESVRALDAACVSCPTATSAVDGRGYRFTGAELLVVPSSPTIEAFSQISVAVWVRPRVTGAGTLCVVGKPLGPDVGNSWQMCLESDLSLSGCFGPDMSYCSSSEDNVVLVDTWAAITLVFDGARMKLWVGGRLVVDEAKTLVMDGSDIVIGGDLDSGAPVAGFIGDLDDVRIWDVALTDAHVAELVGPLGSF